MNYNILRIFLFLFPLLTLASCDSDAHLIEYEDVLGAYEGIGQATVTIGADKGIDWPEIGHLNYGDTLLSTITSPDTLIMSVEVDTNNRMSFFTYVPSITVLGRKISIYLLNVENVHTAIKGNHVVTWDNREIVTSTTVLPLSTLYVPVNEIEIRYADEEGNIFDTVAKGYLAASLANYSIDMDLMIKEAPGLLSPGCTLWMTYSGVMFSRFTLSADDVR